MKFYIEFMVTTPSLYLDNKSWVYFGDNHLTSKNKGTTTLVTCNVVNDQFMHL